MEDALKHRLMIKIPKTRRIVSDTKFSWGKSKLQSVSRSTVFQ